MVPGRNTIPRRFRVCEGKDMIKLILGIIFAPIVTGAAIKMALDMNKPRRGGRRRR